MFCKDVDICTFCSLLLNLFLTIWYASHLLNNRIYSQRISDLNGNFCEPKLGCTKIWVDNFSVLSRLTKSKPDRLLISISLKFWNSHWKHVWLHWLFPSHQLVEQKMNGGHCDDSDGKPIFFQFWPVSFYTSGYLFFSTCSLSLIFWARRG